MSSHGTAANSGDKFTHMSNLHLGSSTGGGGFKSGLVAVGDVTAYTVLAKNSGKIHIMPNVTADITYTLPAAEYGLRYDFQYNGAAADAEAHIFATAATDELFAGGVVFHDHNIGGAGIEVLAVYADFSNDDLLTVDLPEVGTQLTFLSDGASWFVNGQVISDTAPVFA
jgi:hypothetical protein